MSCSPVRVVLAAAPIAIALLLAPAAAQDAKVWKLGVIDPKGDAGFSFMVGERDFAAKQGIKVEIVPLKDGSVAHKGLLAGELQAIESFPGASIMAGSRGADIRIIGCDWPALTHGLMVRAPIKSVADLKGKTVAVAAPGSLPGLVLGAILDKYKVPRDEVKTAPLGGDPTRFKALLNHVVDASINVSEFLPLAPKDISMLVPGREGLPFFVRNCITTTGRTLKERPDDAVKFLAAEITALRYATKHRDETIALTRRVTHAKADDPRPEYAYDDTVKNHLIDPEVSLPLDKLHAMQESFIKAGNLKAPYDLHKISAPEVRTKALAKIGG
jgi:NitT/TauT family transport system substrate-binding protein